MSEENGEKSQDATPHRRQQSREEGQVAQSQDLTSAGLLLGGLMILVFTGGALLDFLVNFLASYLSGGPWMNYVNSGTAYSNDSVISQWMSLMPGLGRV